MTLKEAAQQALKALEQIDGAMPFPVGQSAITALRQALERADEPVACGYDESTGNCTKNPCCYTRPQPADEPVAWVCYGISSDEKHCLDYEQSEIDAVPVGTMLYTQPQEFVCSTGLCRYRKPLTDEEVQFIYADSGYNDIQMFARAIEAAHGITGEPK